MLSKISRTQQPNEPNEGVMTSFVNESIAPGTPQGLACGCLCVLTLFDMGFF